MKEVQDARETSGRSLCGIQRIEFGGHDEVITMEASDFVRPQAYGYATPFRQNGGVMSFFFRQGANSISKPERFGEIAKPKNLLQSLNSVALHNHPFRNLWLKLIDLELGHSRRVSPAGSTLFFAQYAYSTHQ